jgi:hypothetical protein
MELEVNRAQSTLGTVHATIRERQMKTHFRLNFRLTMCLNSSAKKIFTLRSILTTQRNFQKHSVTTLLWLTSSNFGQSQSIKLKRLKAPTETPNLTTKRCTVSKWSPKRSLKNWKKVQSVSKCMRIHQTQPNWMSMMEVLPSRGESLWSRNREGSMTLMLILRQRFWGYICTKMSQVLLSPAQVKITFL